MRPPDEIRTDRLILRRWHPDHAIRLKAAIDKNLGHLQAWMPWAAAEPTPVAELALRLAQFHADFNAGRQWLFGLFPFDETTVLGGLGLHPAKGPNAPAGSVEIGYWLQAEMTGRGYATEAVEAAARLPGVARAEIRCDPGNIRSAAVARRLGFRHVTTIRGNAISPSGMPRDTMIWRLRPKP